MSDPIETLSQGEPEAPQEQPEVVTPEPEVVVAPETMVKPMPPVKRQHAQGDPAPDQPLAERIKFTNELALESLAVPSAPSHVIEAAAETLPENAQTDEVWATVMNNVATTHSEGEGEDALTRDAADWRREMSYNTKRIGSRAMRVPKGDGRALTGQNALMAFRSHNRGTSGAVTTFWGSGVEAKFLPLDNSALYRLMHGLSAERIRAGRATFGVALTAQMSYTVEAILEAATQNLYRSSLKNGVNLGDALRVTDFPTLVWGLAQSTYTDGFEISRACIASPTTCNHVVVDKVQPGRMWLVDNEAISEEQRRWMATAKEGAHSLEDLQPYQDHFPKLRSRGVDVLSSTGHKNTFNLRVPTLNEMIASSKGWIESINNAVVESIGERASFKERNDMMSDLMRAASACQFAHWVESIEFDGTIIDKHEDILSLLGAEVSADSELLAGFFQAIREFREAMSTTEIVVNNYRCPACNKFQMRAPNTDAEDEQPPMYVPVEPVNAFFGLTYRRLRKVANR